MQFHRKTHTALSEYFQTYKQAHTNTQPVPFSEYGVTHSMQYIDKNAVLK
jgi:hypothetical protein